MDRRLRDPQLPGNEREDIISAIYDLFEPPENQEIYISR
jgi:hypothetical protein